MIKSASSPISHRTIALAVLAIALAGSLALGARIADQDCARLAGPGLWASAPAWLADGLTKLRVEAYARCVAAEGR